MVIAFHWSQLNSQKKCPLPPSPFTSRYVNVFANLVDDPEIKNTDRELAINIVALFVNAGIVTSSLFELLADATFLAAAAAGGSGGLAPSPSPFPSGGGNGTGHNGTYSPSPAPWAPSPSAPRSDQSCFSPAHLAPTNASFAESASLFGFASWA